jgi:hypothetical protein
MKLTKWWIIVTLFFHSLSSFSQDSSYWLLKYPDQHWQTDTNWDAPGNYEVATALSKSRIYEGDSVKLDIFFTGYGIVGNSKIFILLSDSIFSSNSYMVTSMGKDFANSVYFGIDTFPLTAGYVYGIAIEGIKGKSWPYSSSFMDVPGRKHSIMSEELIGSAPVHIVFKAKKKVRSDDYPIKIYFTYFNGVEWRSSQQILSLHLNTWIEEHYILVWIIGIVISIIGFITLPAINILIIKLRKFILNELQRLNKKTPKRNIKVDFKATRKSNSKKK